MDIQKYTGIYATSGDVREAVSAGTLHNPYIAIVQDGNYIDWNGNSSPTPPVPPEPVYSAMPLTFEILSGGTIGWVTANNNYAKTISYRINDGAWTQITSYDYPAPSFSVNAGDVVEFKGNNDTYGYYNGGNNFRTTGVRFNVMGNIMSLIDGDNYQNLTGMTSANNDAFAYLFGYAGVVSAENLILPATTLADRCYSNMFNGRASLTTAPELPATTLASNCYQGMFVGCTSLTTAPALPATTLASYCYNSMFWGCTSLTTAPSLPATTLKDNCYESMFRGCTSLTTAPELPATSATKERCYYEMFRGCSRLNYVKCNIFDPRRAAEEYALNNWLAGVAGNGTFVKNMYSISSWWPTGNSGIPNGWTVIDA